MGNKTKIVLPVAAILLVAAFCLTAAPSSAMSTAPGIYHFFGRVMDQEDKPVGSCAVLLIKRITQKEEKKTENQQTAESGGGQQGEEAANSEEIQYVVTNEEVVATTDEDGNYAFTFEPLTADDFWAIFKAEGYRSRTVDLNKLMRSRFFQKPNKSPISLHIVLEKE